MISTIELYRQRILSLVSGLRRGYFRPVSRDLQVRASGRARRDRSSVGTFASKYRRKLAHSYISVSCIMSRAIFCH